MSRDFYLLNCRPLTTLQFFAPWSNLLFRLATPVRGRRTGRGLHLVRILVPLLRVVVTVCICDSGRQMATLAQARA